MFKTLTFKSDKSNEPGSIKLQLNVAELMQLASSDACLIKSYAFQNEVAIKRPWA